MSLTSKSTAAALKAMAGKPGPDPGVSKAIIAWRKIVAKEEASLIDPYLEDPERYLAWEVDDAAGEVSAIPRSNTAKVKRVATACIETFGLNREELRQLRYETLEGLDSAREALSLPGLPAAKRAKLIARLQRSAAGARPFAAMTRYFLFDVWKIL